MKNLAEELTLNNIKKRLSDQLMSKNLLEFYKRNISFKNKKLSYESFIKEVYGSKQ